MPKYPKIQSPCPVKADIDQYMDGDMCRYCQNKVYDLDGMTDKERTDLIESSGDDLCVSYTFPLAKTVAAAAAAASLAALPAAAQEAPTAEPVEGGPCAENSCPDAMDEELRLGGLMIMVGGIKKPGTVEYVDADSLEEVPEIQVVYEDDDIGPELSSEDMEES